MTNYVRVLTLLRQSSRGLTDAEIGRLTGITPHAQVNQICNLLARRGLTSRTRGLRGHYINQALRMNSEAAIPLVIAELTSKKQTEGRKSEAQLSIDFAKTLFVIPCSAGKLCGGVKGSQDNSILDHLPSGLAEELCHARRNNAVSSQLDESRTMAALERYNGLLYEAAADAFERLEQAGALLAILSGGYGIVLGREQIGWYNQSFVETAWSEHLVSRCLSSYAEVAGVHTVVGLLGRTTAYAKAFRRVIWSSVTKEVWMITPHTGGGALRKVPRAIGEVLTEISETGLVSDGWTSNDDVPVELSVLRSTKTDLDPSKQVPRQLNLASPVLNQMPHSEAGRIAAEIVEDFYGGRLNLNASDALGVNSWAAMPEVEATDELRRMGAPDRAIRSFVTFISAMDRARDATRLWRLGVELFFVHPEVFDPSVASSIEPAKLSALLSTTGVSQRHKPDAEAWQTIARSVDMQTSPVASAVIDGVGNASELLKDVRSRDRKGRYRFPMLRGPKIGPMWIRILANPGGAKIDGMDVVPVAVDVHVRRVTVNLGVVGETDLQGAKAKKTIQKKWKVAVAAGDIGGPKGIEGTCAALDPALWFFGKYGCSRCEQMLKQIPISRVCQRCRLGVCGC